MFEDLKRNLEQEKKIIMDMRAIAIGYRNDPVNRAFYGTSLKALAEQLDYLNNAVPELLKEWSPFAEMPESVVAKPLVAERKTLKPLVAKPEIKKLDLIASRDAGEAKKLAGKLKVIETAPIEKKTVSMSYVSPATNEKRFITINKEDRKNFLKTLKLSEEALEGVKKIKEEGVGADAWKPNMYIVFSSKYFGRFSDKWSRQFDEVSKDLKNANIPILLSSYLSMAMMSCCIAFVFGVFMFLLLLLFSLSNWIYFFLPFGFVGLTMFGFYFYPSSEASSVHKSVSYELPFSTIHMAAIAGSNITPVKIFKIIAASVEYPNIGAEMKKIVVQIEVYGYDIVTSLKNVAKTTSNKQLAELFSGLATNISSGGALKNYLDKKSESFLVDYRLERQKYSALAGTFMDVYISILIAAPLVLMMMFIVMNVAGLGMGGLGITSLMFLAIGGIVVTNIVFIVVLNMKQPRM